MIVK
jgi:transposase-like protein